VPTFETPVSVEVSDASERLQLELTELQLLIMLFYQYFGSLSERELA